MSGLYFSLSDTVLQSGLLLERPYLVQRLRRNRDKMLSFASDASPISGIPSSKKKRYGTRMTLDSDKTQDETLHTRRDTVLEVPDQLESSTREINTGTNQDTISQSLVDVFNIEGISTMLGNQYAQPLSPEKSLNYPLLSEDAWSLELSLHSIEKTSFARRLHRTSLEYIFRLLLRPTIDIEELVEKLRFNLSVFDRKASTSRVHALLQRGSDEELEHHIFPFYQIGGAGTHYPRRDKDGFPICHINALSQHKS